MGNVNGRKDEAEASGTKENIIKEEEEEEEEFMEYYGHGGGGGGGYDQMHARFPETMMVHHSPPPPPPHNPNRPYHLQSPFFSSQNEDMNNTTGNGIAALITWNYGGNQVAIEGSWDNWRTREMLQKTGKEIFKEIVKVLPSGVYHYRFVADGHYRYDPNLPYEEDGRGNVFNVLDLQDEEIMVENVEMNEEERAGTGTGGSSSPLSSYGSIPFSLEDLNEKLPEIPLLLQKTPLESERSSETTLKKPLHSILNHLYIQTATDHSTVALASTHRFRRKFVTTILYKSSNFPKK